MDYRLLAKAGVAGLVVGLLGFSIATLLGLGQTSALLITFGALLVSSCGVLMYAQATEEKTLGSEQNPLVDGKRSKKPAPLPTDESLVAESKADTPMVADGRTAYPELRDRQQQALQTTLEVAEEIGQISDQLVDDFLAFARHTDDCPQAELKATKDCTCGYAQAKARADRFKS